MSKKKLKKYTNKFKAKVILEILKNEKTINQIACENKVIPRNVTNWKKQFIDNMELVFDREKIVDIYKNRIKDNNLLIDDLYRQIGKLKTQLDWTKKKSEEIGFEY